MSHKLTEGWGQCPICNSIVELEPPLDRPCPRHPATEDSWGPTVCQVYYHCQLLEVVVLICRWRNEFLLHGLPCALMSSRWAEETQCVILCGQGQGEGNSFWLRYENARNLQLCLILQTSCRDIVAAGTVSYTLGFPDLRFLLCSPFKDRVAAVVRNKQQSYFQIVVSSAQGSW